MNKINGLLVSVVGISIEVDQGSQYVAFLVAGATEIIWSDSE